MTDQSREEGALGHGGRRPRVMRPYEWTHTDTQFAEWLRRQGFSEDNWAPQAWASGPGMRRAG